MRWIVLGCVLIVAFEALYALAAKTLRFEYGGFPSILFSLAVETAIYVVPAYMAARAARSVQMGAVAGATVALAGATIGVAATWLIGPGIPPPDLRGGVVTLIVVLLVTAVGAAFGLAAGVIARRTST